MSWSVVSPKFRVQEETNLTNAQFPMLNSHPREKPRFDRRWILAKARSEVNQTVLKLIGKYRRSPRMRIEHWELSIGQIHPILDH